MEVQLPMESTSPRNICGEHSHLWGAQITGTPMGTIVTCQEQLSQGYT